MIMLRHSLLARTIAYLLGSLAMVSLLISSFLLIQLGSAGVYQQPEGDSTRFFYQIDGLVSQRRETARQLAIAAYAVNVFIPDQKEAGREPDPQWVQSMQQTLETTDRDSVFAASWTVTDQEGNLIWSDQGDQPTVLTFTDAFHLHPSEVYGMSYGYDSDFEQEDLDNNRDFEPLIWTVETRLYQLEPQDSYLQWLYHQSLRVHAQRQLIAVAPVVTALLLLACLFFLGWIAGYKKAGDGISSNWFDRIPLEIFLAVVAMLLVMVGLFLTSLFRQSWVYHSVFSFFRDFSYVYLILAIWLGALLLLRIFSSIAVRLKAGRWWRGSLIWMFSRWLLHLASLLPLLWQALLVIAAMVVLELLFIANHGLSGPVLIFGILLHLVLIPVICLFVLQLKRLQIAAEQLASGNLSYQVDTYNLVGSLRHHGEHLNSIRQGMAQAVNEQLKSERFKTELITNVSHDIKTPLTSIINYVDLLKAQPFENDTAREYIQVIDRQAARLKKLTEDLVAASKAATGAMPVRIEPVDLTELLAQTQEAYVDRLEEAGLELVCRLPEQPLTLATDGQLLWRILDNLFQNICKYSLPDTRVYVDVGCDQEQCRMTLRNISREALNISQEELFERFVQGDPSRASDGSGLGLAIARSLAELLGGKLELAIDGDLFKAILILPRRQVETGV